MQHLTPSIGKNLKEIRLRRNLSLDDASKLTGVSKAMLGQIERGDSNPTVSTLWKIATGLKVSFSSFINDAEDSLEVISQENINPIIEEDNKMKLYPIFPFDAAKGFEIFTIELKSGCFHSSSPHADDVEEYIIVTEGQMEFEIDNKNLLLKKGDSLKFKANKPHSYHNATQSKVIFQNIILYQR